ncbi:unnamed protein product [Peronospora destructor]|uniref:Sulfhydryl oxidase n=1 Tax=Peronospora destructor TaxID=86335 RepID=A0AAV0UC87_9STRA|nr:unnamed protein product [Peronospora destructor]
MYHVPAEAEKAITMPPKENVNARYVAEWIEETLKKNKMQPGIDVDEVYLQKYVLRNDRKKKEFYLGDPVKPTANAMSYPANLFADKDALVLCKALTSIRPVVKRFFGCEECRRHFLKVNTESVIEKLARSDEDGPYAVALWIWMIHNAVSKALNKPMWLTKLSCPHCYDVDDLPLSLDPTLLNEEFIVAYIRSVYKFGDYSLSITLIGIKALKTQDHIA